MKEPNLLRLSSSWPLTQIPAVLARLEQMRRQHRIEGVDHRGDFQILGVVDSADEIAPEVAQHIAPRHFAVGNEIELLFEARREIVLDIFCEKALEESDHDTSAVLRIEPPLIEPHIFAVLEHLQDRRVG